jgi:hypothetical protein
VPNVCVCERERERERQSVRVFGAIPYSECLCCKQPSTAPPPRLHALQRPPRAAQSIHSAKEGVCRVRVVLARIRSHSNTHTPQTPSLSLFHSHTHTHARTHTNTREKYVLETEKTHTITSFRMSGWQPDISDPLLKESNISSLRSHALGA